jgi:exodeoxyribonuclease-3
MSERVRRASSTFTVVTWNVNSIRKRLDIVLAWIARKRPDVLCLQETKCAEDRFPSIGFASLGYQVVVVGQKSYNGVAIASIRPQSEIDRSPVWPENPEARSAAVTVDGVRILNVYVPHGDEVGTPGFKHKLMWLERLRRRLDVAKTSPTIVSGDFNVAPEDRDAYDPQRRHERLICSTPEREHFRRLLDAGYVDAFRQVNGEGGHYTWWSHRVDAVVKNRGLRVDHHLVSRALRNRIVSVEFDVGERRHPGASDHAPVTLTINNHSR